MNFCAQLIERSVFACTVARRVRLRWRRCTGEGGAWELGVWRVVFFAEAHEKALYRSLYAHSTVCPRGDRRREREPVSGKGNETPDSSSE